MNECTAAACSRSARGLGAFGVVAALVLGLAACEKKTPPRSYDFFMDDRIAREGTLVRCDRNPVEAQTDIECANARRADVEIALRAERQLAEERARESAERMEAMRQQLAESERIAREAALEVIRQEREAYEAIWRSRNEDGSGDDSAAGAEIPGGAGADGELTDVVNPDPGGDLPAPQ